MYGRRRRSKSEHCNLYSTDLLRTKRDHCKNQKGPVAYAEGWKGASAKLVVSQFENNPG
jgi:hypothetical protein